MKRTFDAVIPKSLIRYIMAGVLTNGAVYVIFVLFIWAGMSPIWAAALCYAIGLTLSYLVNRKWSFESTASHRSDLLRFGLSYAIGFVATLVFIALLTQVMRPEIAQILNIGLTAVVIYACLQLTGFGKGISQDAD